MRARLGAADASADRGTSTAASAEVSSCLDLVLARWTRSPTAADFMPKEFCATRSPGRRRRIGSRGCRRWSGRRDHELRFNMAGAYAVAAIDGDAAPLAALAVGRTRGAGPPRPPTSPGSSTIRR